MKQADVLLREGICRRRFRTPVGALRQVGGPAGGNRVESETFAQIFGPVEASAFDPGALLI